MVAYVLIVFLMGFLFIIYQVMGTDSQEVANRSGVNEANGEWFEKEVELGMSMIRAYISNIGLENNKEIIYKNSDEERSLGLIIDDYNKRIVIVNPLSLATRIINYEDIIGMDIFVNGVKKDWVGRTLAGAILAGGTGAIVGAVTADTTVNTIKGTIYTNQVLDSKIEMVLNRGRVNQEQQDSTDEMNFFNEIKYIVRAIVDFNNNSERVSRKELKSINIDSKVMYDIFVKDRSRLNENVKLIGYCAGEFRSGDEVSIYDKNFELLLKAKVANVEHQSKEKFYKATFGVSIRALEYKRNNKNTYSIEIEDTNDCSLEDAAYVVHSDVKLDVSMWNIMMASIVEKQIEKIEAL